MAEAAEGNNKKKICIIAGVVLLIVAAGFIGLMVMKNKSADEGANPTPSAATGGPAGGETGDGNS
ncbi:uncharacterized protein NESG_01423 [Nematocida ausubeli]|uniref:Uncharacterized protein n=1 Tax=Nematocida ausubeli (strain ATCC PRA-371 / ERTm2) TaxID=1913371 RepID=A0A086J2D5_NEMA1|nr:uncharacterized protein NESG_01423 [Nematocida ausubeli]KFG26303.1 hypothetical protein NESG_01423 [Nematocida ausubeli]